jgi:GTP-binding protein LepA
MPRDSIRNFCIIAHIDHGKSTLADRILEVTGALSKREMREQFLDRMDLERERGITIKAQSVRLNYKSTDGQTYELNLIDTPGHVDFHYEVSRSLHACEGALLLIDATQGVEAQTVANFLIALDAGLEIIPIINKIDLKGAEVDRVAAECEEVLGLPAESAIPVSAKTGQGVRDVLEAIVQGMPKPRGSSAAPLRALVFDSWFDSYQGAVALVRVVDGSVSVGQNIISMHSGKVFEVHKLGVYNPHAIDVDKLDCGEVGFIIANIKEVRDAQIGDTFTLEENPAHQPLPGFKEAKPMVFAGLYPTDSHRYGALRDALDKLKLNDAAFSFEPETSNALGFGFRCGFLGSLHLEIVQERLEREFDMDLVTTAPTVVYQALTTAGKEIWIDNPEKLPEPNELQELREPYANAAIHCPVDSIGNILALCQQRRGEQEGMEYFGRDRVVIRYKLPFAEMMYDFHDQLKSISRGYASLDYEIEGYQPADLVKIKILVNGEQVDALSTITHKEHAYYRGRELVQKMRSLIPRQQFDVAIQAAIGGRIIARETVKALRKDVTAKCYGGDVTRKRKLLEKQKEGKKRMKRVANVDIPQEAFLAVLKIK